MRFLGATQVLLSLVVLSSCGTTQREKTLEIDLETEKLKFELLNGLVKQKAYFDGLEFNQDIAVRLYGTDGSSHKLADLSRIDSQAVFMFFFKANCRDCINQEMESLKKNFKDTEILEHLYFITDITDKNDLFFLCRTHKMLVDRLFCISDFRDGKKIFKDDRDFVQPFYGKMKNGSINVICFISKELPEHAQIHLEVLNQRAKQQAISTAFNGK